MCKPAYNCCIAGYSAKRKVIGNLKTQVPTAIKRILTVIMVYSIIVVFNLDLLFNSVSNI